MKSTTLIFSILLLGIAVEGKVALDDSNPRGMRLPPPVVSEVDDHSASNSSSSSSSSSESSSDASLISAADSSSSSDSDSSSSDSDSSSSNVEFGYLRKFHRFLDSASRQEKPKCSKGKYSKGEECLPCSMCGPDLYIRESCRSDSDTVCDWCLNMKAVKNDDFDIKCFTSVKVRREFEQLLRRPHSQIPSEQDIEVVFVEKDPAPYVSYTTIREPFILSKVSQQNAWKLEMLVEACFYLVLIALIFAVIRFISKTKPYYRTVTVNPPMLTDTDNNNIIRAAEHIRRKIGQKGYQHLEEFI